MRNNLAKIGDLVRTPTNVLATVIEATGEGRYDKARVRERTPERDIASWRVGQLLVVEDRSSWTQQERDAGRRGAHLGECP